MEIPRSEERFTPEADAARFLVRVFGGRVAEYATRGEATQALARGMDCEPGTDALTLAARFVAKQAARHHVTRGPRESYYGRGQAKRDYDLIRHK